MLPRIIMISSKGNLKSFSLSSLLHPPPSLATISIWFAWCAWRNPLSDWLRNSLWKVATSMYWALLRPRITMSSRFAKICLIIVHPSHSQPDAIQGWKICWQKMIQSRMQSSRGRILHKVGGRLYQCIIHLPSPPQTFPSPLDCGVFSCFFRVVTVAKPIITLVTFKPWKQTGTVAGHYSPPPLTFHLLLPWFLALLQSCKSC